MTHRRALASLLVPVSLAASLLLGCGKTNNPVSPAAPVVTPGLPDSVPQATTPALLLARLEAALELRHVGEYDSLLTVDFRFQFSADSDPALVAQYGNLWDRQDELASFGHLVTGFTDEQSTYQFPATRIHMSLGGTSIVDDPDHADSTAHYRLAIVPSLHAGIELSDGTFIEIASPHQFHLVRGDAAVLGGTQVARADRWYLYRWEDHSVPLALGLDRQPDSGNEPARVMPATPLTWGRLKAVYR